MNCQDGNDDQFLELLKKYSFDTQSFFKKIANTTIYMLLVSKPEQETILLTMLVQKLSDSDNTVFIFILFLLDFISYCSFIITTCS